jgi:poly-gamma-glutamate synthesis protein (capsule biosynthesis protein)
MRLKLAAIFFLYLIFAFLQAEQEKLVMIEDFESGTVSLSSYANEDNSPSAWSLDQTYTYNSSQYALKLSGNTWKQQNINPLAIMPDDVLQVAIRSSGNYARIQGVGFSNGIHTLFYSIEGTATLNIEQWVTVYQGAFSTATWNLFQLPIADDWWAYFDELPTITSVIYINDLDTGTGSVWFDNLSRLTSEIPSAPNVSISYNAGPVRKMSNNAKNVSVSFFSIVYDPDSSVFTYHWDFGDSTFSNSANPIHTYTVNDDHPYTVMLKVTDNTERWGLASCQVNVDAGTGNLPITLNFVGDIMLARDYDAPGGIIATQGVNAIFQPTKPLLGDAADITSANLEVVLTNQGTPHPTKSVVYRGNPANVSGLSYAGIDIVSVANNHVLDYGLIGLNQMLDSLDARNILYSGAGANSYEAYTPAFVNKHGLNIAFLRSSDRTGQYNNTQPYLNAGYNKPGFALFTPYYLMEQLAAVDSIADLKIVEMHGGSEYSLSPGSDYDRSVLFEGETLEEDYSLYTDVPHMWDIAIRHYAVDNGADLVIVHHPHILHGFEMYNGKLIAHSLGNFVFDLDYPETMPTLILYADADVDGFSNFRVVPCFIDRLIPRRATAKLGVHILDYLAKRSRDLNTYLLVNKDDATARVVTDPSSISFYPTVTNLQAYLTPLFTDTYITEPIKLMRNGNISSLDYTYPGSGWQARLGQECIWMGNMENEGSTLFNPNLSNETYDTAYFHEGLRSLKISATGTEESVALRNKMKWYYNTKKYTLHAWIRTRGASAVNIEIQYFSSRTNNNPVSTETLLATPLNDNNEWAFYSKEITIPSNCSYYNIVMKNSSGNAWFDEVGLIEWTAWEDVSVLQSIPFPNDYYWLQVKGSENPKRLRIQYTEKDLVPLDTASSPAMACKTVSALTNYPNPCNPETTISFLLNHDSEVELSIYNIKGQLVRILVHDTLSKGRHSLIWDGKDRNETPVGSGVYFYQVRAGTTSEIRKLILLK